MATPAETQSGVIRSLIPARIDRLPWSPFHTRMVIALGVAWILDGLEITVASAVADTLSQPETLALSSAAVGLIATVYLAGEVVGALFFGRLSDKLGRRNLFMITLGVYLVGSGLTALTLGNGAGWIAGTWKPGRRSPPSTSAPNRCVGATTSRTDRNAAKYWP